MNKLKVLIVLIFLAIILGYATPKIYTTWSINNSHQIKTLLVYHPDYLKKSPQILAAYESMLQEEGVAYEKIDVYSLLEIKADELTQQIPAVIFPDSVLQNVPGELSEWSKKYLASGGNVAVIYDVGIKHQQGYFLDSAVLADITGVNYITYKNLRDDFSYLGTIKFTSTENRDFFEIPLGKTVGGLTISGYGFGALHYSVVKNEPNHNLKTDEIYAYAHIVGSSDKVPAVVLRDHDQGKVLYVNLPLGHLKSQGDELLLRSIIRTFLFDIVHIPHVMNVENGIGGLVINWHVDSAQEHTNIPNLLRNGFFDQRLRTSIHITAGDFVDEPGDGLGFKAATDGKQLVQQLMDKGVIGSHGGWAHDWFARSIREGQFDDFHIEKYISKNVDALEPITGYKIREYSAPVGVHPQPITSSIIEKMGMNSYYYTGDSGSGPTRSFFNGQMISRNLIAFPVMPFGKRASLWEMKALDHRSNSEVHAWFNNLLDYIQDNNVVRLFYSHPVDVVYYPDTVKQFLDRAALLQSENKIVVRPMSEFADFFLRFLETQYVFIDSGKQMIIDVTNEQGLKGITIAVPKRGFHKPVIEKISVIEGKNYYYLVITEPVKTKKIYVDKLAR